MEHYFSQSLNLIIPVSYYLWVVSFKQVSKCAELSCNYASDAYYSEYILYHYCCFPVFIYHHRDVSIVGHVPLSFCLAYDMMCVLEIILHHRFKKFLSTNKVQVVYLDKPSAHCAAVLAARSRLGYCFSGHKSGVKYRMYGTRVSVPGVNGKSYWSKAQMVKSKTAVSCVYLFICCDVTYTVGDFSSSCYQVPVQHEFDKPHHNGQYTLIRCCGSSEWTVPVAIYITSVPQQRQ